MNIITFEQLQNHARLQEVETLFRENGSGFEVMMYKQYTVHHTRPGLRRTIQIPYTYGVGTMNNDGEITENPHMYLEGQKYYLELKNK